MAGIMNNEPGNITTLKHWDEWFELCSINRCCAETAGALGKFAHLRYEKKLIQYLDKRGLSEDKMPSEPKDLLHDPRPGACWRDLEAEYWHSPKPPETGETPASPSTPSKLYKKFYREVSFSCPDLDSRRKYLEGATTDFLIRTRCRKLIQKGLRYRLATEKEVESASNRDDPDEQGEVFLPLDQDIQVAEKIFNSLDARDKILLLAKEGNVSLKDDQISSRLGMGHSALYLHQAKAVAKVRGILEKKNLSRRDSFGVAHVLQKILGNWAYSPECGISGCLMRDDT